jgi:hypothetical protein
VLPLAFENGVLINHDTDSLGFGEGLLPSTVKVPQQVWRVGHWGHMEKHHQKKLEKSILIDLQVASNQRDGKAASKLMRLLLFAEKGFEEIAWGKREHIGEHIRKHNTTQEAGNPRRNLKISRRSTISKSQSNRLPADISNRS